MAREIGDDDFKKEVLIPYKQSTLGPALESGDVNGDGLDDLFLGNAAGSSGQLLIQNQSGKFIPSASSCLAWSSTNKRLYPSIPRRGAFKSWETE